MMNYAQVANTLAQSHIRILKILARGGDLPPASREQDRVRRLLRKTGLIAYTGKPKRWQISADGLAVLKETKP